LQRAGRQARLSGREFEHLKRFWTANEGGDGTPISEEVDTYQEFFLKKVKIKLSNSTILRFWFLLDSSGSMSPLPVELRNSAKLHHCVT
jgi:hypothetical protein